MTSIDAEIVERLQAKDALLFSLSDTLDVKASIVLVVVTFLGTLSGIFLANPLLPYLLRYGQLAAAVFLAGAGLMAFITLWPRQHELETAETLDEWQQELRAHYKNALDPNEAVSEAFTAGRVQRLKERIQLHTGIDRAKSNCLDWSYRLSAVALALNLTTLIWLALSLHRSF